MKLQVADKNLSAMTVNKNQEIEALLQSHLTRIRVVGCGGGGNNTVTRLMEVGVTGVDTLVINTDAQDLLSAKADDKILIGRVLTKGLGGGSNPQIGEESARENRKEIEEALQGADMVFVTCGLGGGTGSGSAPIVAEAAKRLGALTIAVVTLPFWEEGVMRWENARLGLEKLRTNADTIIIIQNDKLYEIAPDLPLGQAFKVADEVLVNAVKGIIDLVTTKGMVNLDFADIRAIMQNGGTAMIGLGESEGPDRAQRAIEMALQNPLLNIDITGARNALINITGGLEMSLKDTRTIMKIVAEKLDATAKIIWGARIDPDMGNSVRAMVIVTNFQEGKNLMLGADRTLQLQKEPVAVAKIAAPAVVEKPENAKHDANTILTEAKPTQPAPQKMKFAPPRPGKKPAPSLGKSSRPLHVSLDMTPLDEDELNVRATNPGNHMRRAPAQPTMPQEVRPPAAQTNSAGNAVSSQPASTPRLPEPLTPEVKPVRPQESSAFLAKPSPSETQIEFTPPAPAKAPAPPEPKPAVAGPTPAASFNSRSTAGLLSKQKSFKEKNLINLQTLQEAVVYLMANPQDEETWQNIKVSMEGINRSAQMLEFHKIAEYAGTLEEVAERVLQGIFKVTPEIIEVFTRAAAVLDGMIYNDAPAMQVAQQHQAKLQHLANEYREAKPREKAAASAPKASENPTQPAANIRAASQPLLSGPAANDNAQLAGRRAQTDDEVMAYLKGRFAAHRETP